jgi:hypothetical protein
MATAANCCRSSAGHDVQPLVAAAVTVLRTAFGIAWRDYHFSRLRSAVAKRHPEAIAKS